jgi:cell division protein FtsZ
MNRPDERTQFQWGAGTRDTDGEPFSSSPVQPGHPAPPTHTAFSPFNPLAAVQHDVDIVVVGVGGGGMNAINRMMSARVRGVRFVAMNTDAQVLALSPAQQRVSLGQQHTKGLGAGGNAASGERAASESADDIRKALGHADLVFIAAGMGGGTGTGAAPVVASIAKKLGALTVGIVTLPFTFEGTRRRRIAQDGISALNEQIDALITVPNDRLLATVGRDYNLSDAFKIADDVLRQGVQGIAEVINVPGMVNVDFADVRSVLREAGTALMSIGHGQGRNRAQRAADEAIAGGFLNVTIRGAKRVLFNISGGEDMTLFEVNDVAERIGQAIDDAADITFGAVIDPSLHDSIRITLIAAGMEEMHTVRLQALRSETRTSQPYVTGSQAHPPVIPARPSSSVRPPTPQPAGLPTSPPQQHPGQRQEPPARASQEVENEHIQAPGPGPSISPARPALPEQPRQPHIQPYTQHQQPPQHPSRPQRSLDDLRGLRSMAHRYNTPSEDEPVDIPPFLKKREGR